MTIQDARQAGDEIEVTKETLRAELQLRRANEVSQMFCISPASAEMIVDEIFEDVLFLLSERRVLALPLSRL